MQPTKLNILQGKTFRHVLRWETSPVIYAAIEAITNGAPVTITTTDDHDIPDGWRVTVQSVVGMTEINCRHATPHAADFHKATVTDTDVLQLNDIDSSEFGEYVSGGYVRFNTPVSLAGYTARMKVKTKVGGDELLSLELDDGIAIDDTDKTITIEISADDTAALEWKRGVYDLELESGAGEVTLLAYGSVTVTAEVTTADD